MKAQCFRPWFLIALGLCSPSLRADNTPAAMSQSAAPTANYTNSWNQSSSTVISSGSNYYSLGMSSYPTSFGGNWYTPSVITVYQRRLQIYFPPEPVILGQVLPSLPSSVNGGQKSSFLAQMRPFVSESFYPALSAYLWDETLSSRRFKEVNDYRAEKLKLVAELRANLETIHGAPNSERPALLAKLASEESPRIRALETRAEAIRKELVGSGWFSTGVDWNDNRTWRLGDDTRYETYVDEYLVMRAAAYFQEGLTTEQRPLVVELAMDLLRRGQDPTAEISLEGTGSYMFFSPYSSRIRLPLDLPAELSAKISTYRAKKEALKQELRNTIYRTDRAWLNSTRVDALKALAQSQAGALAELETLAEEIRVGLSSCKYPDEPPQSALPADFNAEISAYLREKVELQRALLAKVTEVRAQLPSDRVELVRQGDGVGVQIISSRGGGSDIKARREEVRVQLEEFNKTQIARFANLSVTRDKLRQQVTEMAKQNAAGNRRTVDQMLAGYLHSFSQQELWNRYKDYRTAVLEPGLSPEQRRFLFSAAIETLLADYLH